MSLFPSAALTKTYPLPVTISPVAYHHSQFDTWESLQWLAVSARITCNLWWTRSLIGFPCGKPANIETRTGYSCEIDAFFNSYPYNALHSVLPWVIKEVDKIRKVFLWAREKSFTGGRSSLSRSRLEKHSFRPGRNLPLAAAVPLLGPPFVARKSLVVWTFRISGWPGMPCA